MPWPGFLHRCCQFRPLIGISLAPRWGCRALQAEALPCTGPAPSSAQTLASLSLGSALWPSLPSCLCLSPLQSPPGPFLGSGSFQLHRVGQAPPIPSASSLTLTSQLKLSVCTKKTCLLTPRGRVCSLFKTYWDSGTVPGPSRLPTHISLCLRAGPLPELIAALPLSLDRKFLLKPTQLCCLGTFKGYKEDYILFKSRQFVLKPTIKLEPPTETGNLYTN